MAHITNLRKKSNLKRIRIVILCGLSFSLIIGTTKCYYHNEKDLYAPVTLTTDSTRSTCDTTSVTYSKSVAPILSNYCYACHSGSNSQGVILNTYTGVNEQVTSGRILHAITQDGTVPAMPPNGGKLSTCDIAIITKWIKTGAPDN